MSSEEIIFSKINHQSINKPITLVAREYHLGTGSSIVNQSKEDALLEVQRNPQLPTQTPGPTPGRSSMGPLQDGHPTVGSTAKLEDTLKSPRSGQEN